MMKHFLRKLTAISAAAITAVSAFTATGLTASAFYPSYTSLDHMDIDQGEWNDFLAFVNAQSSYARSSLKGAVAHSVERDYYQKLYPCFSRSFLLGESNVNVTITPTLPTSYGTNTTWFCTFDSTVAGLNKLSTLRSNADKLTVKTVRRGTTENFGLLVEYVMGGTPNKFAARLMNDYYMQHSYLDDLYEGSFTLDPSTGKYSGTINLDDYYIAGLRLSCTDGRTTFGTPVLKRDGDDEYGSFHTEIPFSGTLPFKTDSTLYFSGGQTCTILSNIKVTYNGCQSPMTTNDFKKTYTKNNNSTYSGIIDGNTIHRTIAGYNLTNFNNNRCIGVKESGSTLYICVGKNCSIAGSEWKNGWGETKLKGLLSNGYRDGFKHNTWLMGNIDSYSNICFCWNATTTSKGASFLNITPARFRTLLNTY